MPSTGSADRALAKAAAAYADLYARLAEAERELPEVVARARERAREADQLRFGLDEIEAVSPEPGEDAALAAEEGRLGFADTLRTAAEQAREALCSEQGAPDALATTSAARTPLDGVREHDPQAGELADRLAEVTYLLVDVAADVASYAAGLDTDPARLAAVSERRAALTALTRKYGETIDEVLAWAEAGAAAAARPRRHRRADRRSSRRERPPARAARRRGGHAHRRSVTKAASRLGTAVSDELALLAMPHATVTVDVRPAGRARARRLPASVLQVGGRWLRATAHGVDEVEFLLAANTGADARPLHKGASGGELSRVMLALEVSLAETGPVPTFVFDEVDAGVGGKAAIEVGRRLAAAGPRRRRCWS